MLAWISAPKIADAIKKSHGLSSYSLYELIKELDNCPRFSVVQQVSNIRKIRPNRLPCPVQLGLHNMN